MQTAVQTIHSDLHRLHTTGNPVRQADRFMQAAFQFRHIGKGRLKTNRLPDSLRRYPRHLRSHAAQIITTGRARRLR